MKVCLGGTFSPLHKGHKALISKAFEIGGYVFIGVTSDRLASGNRRRQIAPFEERKAALLKWVHENYPEKPVNIEEIDDIYGPAATGDFDAIIASPGTEESAEKVNEERKKNSLKPLKIVSIDYVLAEDLMPISGTRIWLGDIDENGKRLKTIVVNVGSKNEVKIKAVRQVFRRISKGTRVKIVGIEGETGVSPQPFGRDTIKGAENRARVAVAEGDYGVGIEAGLIWNEHMQQYMDVQYCVIVDKLGRVTFGHGSGFYYPPKVIEKVIGGKRKHVTISDAIREATGIEDIGKKQGAIGYLSKGLMTRTRLTEQSVLMAMVPRVSGEIYL
ncbi:MAG: inosine/xanthosine triphosphatase [Candidatus Thermoplasmatota archaeon]|nr:inosine/xanthosine triphosphatase [Candidatus Thermoplasmatota archaeon]